MQFPQIKEIPMFRCSPELTLNDVLSDSLVQAMMAADGVDPHELEATLREIARTRTRPARDSCRNDA
jgi:hypothetical protein